MTLIILVQQLPYNKDATVVTTTSRAIITAASTPVQDFFLLPLPQLLFLLLPAPAQPDIMASTTTSHQISASGVGLDVDTPTGVGLDVDTPTGGASILAATHILVVATAIVLLADDN